jgi:transcriptional regulator with XRE-family HTH domain
MTRSPGRNSINPKQPHEIDRYVGSRIRLRRMLLGVSQEQLGAELGITFQQIQKYEKGTNRVSSSKLHHIAHFLRVPVQYFYEGVVDTGPDGTFAESHHAADVTRFLNTGESVELMKAFVAITDKRVRRQFVQLVRALAGQQSDAPEQAKAVAAAPDAVLRSPPDQPTRDRSFLFDEAKKGLFGETPPPPENVRLALRKIRHFAWEPQDGEQQRTREALMSACRDYLQPKAADKRASLAAIKRAWEAFAQAWGFETGKRERPRPAERAPITSEEWAL